MPDMLPEDMEKIAPEEKERDVSLGVDNFANNEDTVEKVLRDAKAYFTEFDSQSGRDFLTTKMDRADKVFRVASDIDKEQENKTRDEVDVTPEVFYRQLVAVTSNELDALFGSDKLGSGYQPLNAVQDASLRVTQAVADDQNTLLEYSYEIDDRVKKITDGWWACNKYGNMTWGMEWKVYEKTVRERQPTAYDEEGKPIKYGWKTRKQVVRHPTLVAYDLADVYKDATIPNIQDQQCLLFRSQPSLSTLLANQRAGHYINVGKLTSAQLYRGTDPVDQKQDRAENAGTDGDLDNPNGLYDQWHVVIRSPIDDDGNYDKDKNAPRWFLATFIGNIQGSDQVCVRLERYPYDTDDNGEILYFDQHSHWDDNGAYSHGYADLGWPLFTQAKTTYDQWFDNKNLINAAPWITERGAIITKDKDFAPRRLIQTEEGGIEKLKRVKVESNTVDMQAFIADLERRVRDLFGTTDAYLGEAMGSRTSAAEATNAFKQSGKPAIEKLRRMARLLEWIAETDMKLWRKFSPGDLMISLVQKGEVREIKPANLWGPLRVKVSAVDDFKDDSVKQLEENQLIAQTLPVIAPLLGKTGTLGLMNQIYEGRGIDLSAWIPQAKETDSMHVASSENVGFENGIPDRPKDGEDHDVHLRTHGDRYAQIKLLPDVDPEVRNLYESHMLIHEQMRDAESAQVQQGAQSLQQAPPRTNGEVAGDLIAGAGA